MNRSSLSSLKTLLLLAALPTLSRAFLHHHYAGATLQQRPSHDLAVVKRCPCTSRKSSSSWSSSSCLFLIEDASGAGGPAEVLFGNSNLDTVPTAAADSMQQDNLSMLKSLKERCKNLKQGIGKRYVTRIKPGSIGNTPCSNSNNAARRFGFGGGGGLNIHYEPSAGHDANDTGCDNVVGQLQEGQIITSVGPSRGLWVRHNAGGWSLANFGGFTWLEPINE